MSTYCEMFKLTYVRNYGNNEDPLLVDFIHLSECAKGRLADYIKAKVGYYLVPRIVIDDHFLKLSNYCNEYGDDYGWEGVPCYLEFYPPKQLGVRSPLVMHLERAIFFFDRTCLGNQFDVDLILYLKKYRYVYKGKIHKLLREIGISIYLQLKSYIIDKKKNGLGLQYLCGCLRCERLLRDALIEGGEIDQVIKYMEFGWNTLVMNYIHYDIDDRYESLIKWYTANVTNGD